MEQGAIFDIQRCSLHDGPGIRTTIFLKGCPLRCIWCHNPESQKIDAQISYSSDKCANCLACVKTCPSKAHNLIDGIHVMDRGLCQACGNCAQVCYYGALKRIGDNYSFDQLVDICRKDISYYKHSGGGVTISGGEPMFQFKFLLGLLTRLKAENINTCVETCGYAEKDKYTRILPLVDTFLFDYKETNPERHKAFTGVDNVLILSNLDYLYNGGASIILRCPLVPGVNDDPEHLKGIAELSNKYPDLKGIEIMAFHDLGRDKNRNIGCEPKLADVKTASEEIKQIWLDMLADYGCNRVKIG